MINLTLTPEQALIVEASLANYSSCMKQDFPNCPEWAARAQTASIVQATLEVLRSEHEVSELLALRAKQEEENKAKRAAQGNEFNTFKE
jgi:hypothetical protein